MKHLLIIVLLLLSFTSLAQERCFNAFNEQGQEVEVLCVGQQVRFEDCGNKVPDENEYYLFNYKKESPLPTPASNIKTHTYTTPGRYRVLQIANYGGNSLTDTVSRVFEVREAPAPEFTVIRCANGTISVNITDNSYDSYTINFGDGQQPERVQPNSITPHQYNTQGTYIITLKGAYTGGSCTGTGTATVVTLPPASRPVFRKLTVLQQATNGQIQIELQALQPGFIYLVQQAKGGSLQTLDTIRNVTQASLTHQLQNVNTMEGLSYFIVPLDACGTNFQPSNSVSSTALEVDPGNELVSLSWESAPFSGTFEIYRNGILIRPLDSNARSFIDTDVVCGQPYQYEVRGVDYDSNVSVSARQEALVASTTVPTDPYLFTTFGLNNNIILELELPKGETLQHMSVERSKTGAAFVQIAQVQQTTYTEENMALEQTCYRVSFTNTCGNTSALSNTSCPIILKVLKQDNEAAVILSWTGYEGFPGGVRQYTVELLDGNNNVVSSYTPTGYTFTDRTLSEELQQLRYRIRATAASGAAVTYSNIEVVEQPLLLYIPSGFTPNGDGLNDLLEIKGRLYDSYTLLVYNNLGQVVYRGTEEDTGWDGTYKGRQLPTGAYAYKIEARNSFGTSKQRTGTITLLR